MERRSYPLTAARTMNPHLTTTTSITITVSIQCGALGLQNVDAVGHAASSTRRPLLRPCCYSMRTMDIIQKTWSRGMRTTRTVQTVTPMPESRRLSRNSNSRNAVPLCHVDVGAGHTRAAWPEIPCPRIASPRTAPRSTIGASFPGGPALRVNVPTNKVPTTTNATTTTTTTTTTTSPLWT